MPPALEKKLQTHFATSSALFKPSLLLRRPPLMSSAAPLDVWTESMPTARGAAPEEDERAAGDAGFETEVKRPEARTTAPLVRDRIRVDVTPCFCARRVRRAEVSPGC